MAPRRFFKRTHAAKKTDQIGHYLIVGSNGNTHLRCVICGRQGTLVSNVALLAELNRLRYANGILRPETCRTTSCENHVRPVSEHPSEYYRHGLTPFGSLRMRCKRCQSTLTLGSHYRAQTAGTVNKDIVKDLVNRGALNAILRKTGISPRALYDRIDFIHARMVSFEAFKLKKLQVGRRLTNWERATAIFSKKCLAMQPKVASV